MNYAPDDVDGTITLVVTDLDGGSISASLPLPASQFPDGLGIHPSLKAVAISAGGSHTCATLASGRVTCWGNNNNGELGDGTIIDRLTQNYVQGIETAETLAGKASIAAGSEHSCVVMSGGKVKCWGSNHEG